MVYVDIWASHILYNYIYLYIYCWVLMYSGQWPEDFCKDGFDIAAGGRLEDAACRKRRRTSWTKHLDGVLHGRIWWRLSPHIKFPFLETVPIRIRETASGLHIVPDQDLLHQRLSPHEEFPYRRKLTPYIPVPMILTGRQNGESIHLRRQAYISTLSVMLPI